jgi:uncharacterized protein YcaQ
MTLTLSQARAVMLAAQGLLEPPTLPATKDSVLQVIRRLGVLQIDTIHVVARSPYLVLWSRLGSYETRWLEQLLAETRLFEYWAHAACFIPIEDYPLYRRWMLEGKRVWINAAEWLENNRELADRVVARIQQEGPLRSADFESAKSPGGWWNWKEEKIALEHLVVNGDLMVRARKNFQRIYDLRQRVLPDWDDVRTPPVEEIRRTFTLRAVACLGIARASWVGDYFRIAKNGIAKELNVLVENGDLLVEKVEGWDDPVYLHPEHAGLLAQARAGELLPSYSTLLSPFDPLVWDRARTRELFDFDYTIECYLPATKRRYGYFSLPILHRGALVGRLDAKAFRQNGIFEVRNLVLEPGVEPNSGLVADLRAAIQACADWHGTPQVQMVRCDPSELAEILFKV